MTALPSGWSAALGEHAAPARRHRLDASAWRLALPGGDLLFDAGAGLGPAPEPPQALFLTHGHADHAGGAARLAVPTFAGPLTAAWLGEGDAEKISLDRAIAAGVYPAGYRLVPRTGITPVGPGTSLAFGPVTVTAVATPGHSADHIAWLVEGAGPRTLVGGDALFAGGTVVLQDTWDCSVFETCATIRAIARLGPEAILPGHGPALLGADCRAALAAASERVDRLLPPRLFL